MKSGILISMLLFLLTGCSDAATSSDNEFIQACLSTSNMSEELCECIAAKVRAELSDDGFAFLVATLNENQKAADELRAKMPLDEMAHAGMFMVSAPAACAGEQ